MVAPEGPATPRGTPIGCDEISDRTGSCPGLVHATMVPRVSCGRWWPASRAHASPAEDPTMTRRTLTLGVALAGPPSSVPAVLPLAAASTMRPSSGLRPPAPASRRATSRRKATMSSSAGRRCRSAAAGPSPSAPAMTVARPGSRGCVLDPVSTSSARSASTCEGWAWAVSGLHTAGAPAAQWRVVLDGHQIGSPGFFQIQPAHLQRHQPRAGHRLCGQQAAGGRVAPEGGRRLPRQGLYAGRDRTTPRRQPARAVVRPRHGGRVQGIGIAATKDRIVSPGSGATMRGTSASTSAPGRTSQ